MRYYYTDHVAAAFMQNHYGVQFILSPDSNDPWVNRDDYEIFFFNGLGMIRITKEYYSSSPLRECEKLYIHPDSMGIFEPRDGDLVDCRNWPNLHKQACGIQDYLQGINEPKGKIIQRDGKNFIWPEVE